MGKWTPDQQRVASCFPSMRRVVVPAANGVGKTFLAADLVATFIRDLPAAKVIITAPTNRQVSELLWPHVTERLLALGLAKESWVIPTKPKWSGGDHDSLIGFATNSPMRMQGFHAEHLLIVMDEASGFQNSLVEALEGIAIGPENYILAIGNPNEASGPFYDLTRRPSYHLETISALTHPNILEHREIIPGATSWTSLVDRVRDWCKEVTAETDDTFLLEISDRELQTGPSELRTRRIFLPNDAFRIRYLGRFPSAVAWSLIDRGYINRAMDATIPGDRPRIAAIDVARTGGDRTIYGLRQGDTVTRIRTIAPRELMSQAEEALQLLKEDQPESVIIDASGLGIGFIDHLIQLITGPQGAPIPVRTFYGAAEPIMPSAQKRFANRRTAAYGNLQIAFEAKRISIPPDPDLADELAIVKYHFTSQGLMQLEDKEKIKSILGRSPDVADTLSLLWEFGTEFAWGGESEDRGPKTEYRPQEPEQW